MPDLPTNIVIKLVNQFTAPLRQMTNDFAVLKAAGKSAEKAFDWSMKLNQSAEAVRNIATAVNGLVDGPVELAKNSERSFALLRYQAGVTGTAFDDIRNQVSALGDGSEFDIGQMTNSVTLLMKNSFDASQAIAELPRVMAFAEAHQLSLADATKMTAAVLNGFGDSATETGRYTDLLTQATRVSRFGIQEMGGALTSIAPRAARFGVSVDQSATLLAAFGKAGFGAEKAAGALDAIFGKLSAPRGAQMMAAGLAKVGVKAVDAQGNLRSLPELLSEVYEKSAKLGALSQGRLMEGVFGTADIAGMFKKIGPSGLSDIANQIRDSRGATAELAGVMDTTAADAVERYEGAIRRLKETVGAPLLSGLRGFMISLSEIVDGVRAWSAEHPILTSGIMKLIKGVGILASIVAVVITAIAGLAGALGIANYVIGLKATASVKLLQTAFMGLGKAMMTLFANPVGLVILAVAALGVAIYLLVTRWKQISGYFEGVWERFTNATLGVKVAIVALLLPFAMMLAPLIAIGLAARVVIQHWEPIKAFFVGIANAIGRAFNYIAEKMKVVTDSAAWKFLVANPLAAAGGIASGVGGGVAALGGGVADVFTGGPTKSEVGGELRIKVDGPGSITKADATGGWNMLIDTGFGMASP